MSVISPLGRRRRAIFAWAVLFLLSLAAAAYVGFRLPNLWISTIYVIPLDAGLIRRAGVSVLVQPLVSVTDSPYAAVSIVAFSVLAIVVGVIAFSFMSARWNSQRILILVFLLAPTGGFLFHEVGYLEQVLFLLFALTLALWRRCNPIVAIIPLALGAWFHEMVLLTMWPIMVWVASLYGLNRQRVFALSLPLIAAVALLLVPRPTDRTIESLEARLASSLDFTIRPDALQLFARPLSEVWSEYSVINGLLEVAPVALVFSIIWAAVLVARPRSLDMRPGILVGAWGVSIAPLLLVLAGWDFSRWTFLAFVNFTIVLFLFLSRQPSPCSTELLAWTLTPFLFLYGTSLQYFDDFSPRSFSTFEISQSVQKPDFFELPRQ